MQEGQAGLEVRGNNMIKNLQKIIDKNLSDEDNIVNLLEYIEKELKIKIPNEICYIKTLSELTSRLEQFLESSKSKYNKIIKYIDEDIQEIDQATLLNNDELVDILEYYENEFQLKVPFALLSKKFTIRELKEEISTLKKIQQRHKYIIIYAKLIEDKSTKEQRIEGPYFGEQADTFEAIEQKAKKLMDRQQSSAFLIKIHQRAGRTDQQIMQSSKIYFNKIKNDLIEK